jgi:hypothetical protein
VSFGRCFIKTKLPDVFRESVVLLGQRSILISASLHDFPPVLLYAIGEEFKVRSSVATNWRRAILGELNRLYEPDSAEVGKELIGHDAQEQDVRPASDRGS